MPTIILVRHGETHWNRQKRIQGHGDSPLTLTGIAQAQAYGRAIGGLVGAGVGAGWRVVSSPLPRCVQTAAILCETAGLDFAAVTQDARLKEVHTGSHSGRLKADLSPAELEGSGLDAWFFRCPGGETHAHMAERLGGWLADLAPGDKVIAVSHGVAGRVLRGLYAGRDAIAALAADSPQDAVFLMNGGAIERIACI
jgi:broad specificity phosphatase PhoE